MIIRLHVNGFALFTEDSEKERFELDSIRSANDGEKASALQSIPRNEIKDQPEAFRALAISVACGYTRVGTLK
jgi:hypothetical protein